MTQPNSRSHSDIHGEAPVPPCACVASSAWIVYLEATIVLQTAQNGQNRNTVVLGRSTFLPHTSPLPNQRPPPATSSHNKHASDPNECVTYASYR